ncbi:MAG TPA: hypothetical protein VHF22_09095 [Planctomycetota bacterium]|nr:hypothetical protein [Planctomycetota bacterium]
MTVKDLRSYADRDYLLGLLGLERKSTFVDWILPAFGFFGLGFLVGASVAAYVQPDVNKIGTDVKNRLGEASNVIGNVVNRTTENAFRGGSETPREI